MDPESEAQQAASQILKTAFISVVFSTCYYRTETTSFSHPTQKIVITPPAISQPVAVVKKKKKKTIYLTFDDGPNKGTRKVMHIANEEQVPVTMFIIGEHAFDSPWQNETMDSLAESDMIELANHSYTHAHHRYERFYSNSDSVVKDFARCKDSFDLSNKIARTPGRNIWRTENVKNTDIRSSVTAADSLDSNGYTLVGWDLEWHYDKDLCLKNCADSLLKQIDSVFTKGRTKNAGHLVLLAHDQVYADANDSTQLRSLVSKLKESGEYDLEFISKYPGIKKN